MNSKVVKCVYGVGAWKLHLLIILGSYIEFLEVCKYCKESSKFANIVRRVRSVYNISLTHYVLEEKTCLFMAKLYVDIFMKKTEVTRSLYYKIDNK